MDTEIRTTVGADGHPGPSTEEIAAIKIDNLSCYLNVMSGIIKTPRAKLDSLLALLNSTAQEAIAEYERAGDVPSTESAHPLDSQPPSLALKNAVRILEGACEQLCTTLAPPVHTLLTVCFIPYP
jgi:hypothetical protein